MAESTWKAMSAVQDEPDQYDPANYYPSSSYFYLSLDDERLARIRHVYRYGNARQIENPLEVFPKITLYCARLTDTTGLRLLGIKQTSGLGRRLKKPRRVRLTRRGLELANEPEFQLAKEFDFLVDSTNVLVYNHNAFEGVGRLRESILESASENLNSIQCQMDYVDFSNLGGVARSGLRAARMLSSIRAGNLAATFSQQYLMQHCDKHKIKYEVRGGKLVIDPADGVEFFKVVARYYTRFRPSEDLEELYYSPSRNRVG
jgi:hypothetical protein